MRLSMKTLGSAAVVAAFMAVLPQTANAQGSTPPSRLYGVIGGSVLFPGNTNLSDTGCPGAATFLACGSTQQISADTGWGAFGGVGYRFMPWLRAELRIGGGGTTARGTLTGGPTYEADYRSISGLVNGYVDVAGFLAPGALGPFEPYVGFGLGVSNNRVSDVQIIAPFFTVSPRGGSSTEFAWAVTAGTGIRLGSLGLPRNLLLDIAYRYRDFGEVTTEPGVAFLSTGGSFVATSGFRTRARAHGIDFALRVEF